MEIQALFEFRQLIRKWSKHINDKIFNTKYFVLEILDAKGPLPIPVLADILSVSEEELMNLLDNMVVGGLVQRNVYGGDDDQVIVKLTPKGGNMSRLVREEQRKWVDLYFDGITEQELEHLVQLSDKLMSNYYRNSNRKFKRRALR